MSPTGTSARFTLGPVPEISRFYGIVIKMYWDEHPPAHFHAEYAEHEAVIEVGSGTVLYGALPHRALRMVRQWESVHRAELATNWGAARRSEPLRSIDPLP